MEYMADISTIEEAIYACELGADLISTTLAGYLPGKEFRPEEKYIPNFQLIETILCNDQVNVPVIGEGRFWTPEALKKGLSMGLYGVVIGKAITNAWAITQYFTAGINDLEKQ